MKVVLSRVIVAFIISLFALPTLADDATPLSTKLKNASKVKRHTVRGDISFEKQGRVRLTFTKDAYALVDEKYIDADYILPLKRGEDPSGRNSKWAVSILDGATIELHVDTLSHTFTLSKDEKPFYIDPTELKVVYLVNTKQPAYCEYKCRKNVTIVDVYCCGNGFAHGGYGYVGCGEIWCDEPKCCR